MGFLPLSRLFLDRRAPEHPVALTWTGPGDRLEVRTWERFARDAAAVAARARAAGGRRWLLGCDRAWDFAVGMFGLLLAERTVVLPPNFQPRTLEMLAAEADGTLRRAEPAAPGTSLPPAAEMAGDLEFWTAGSTGAPKAVPKVLAQLDAEVALLDRCFGRNLGTRAVVGTVPHHHIYGCLFRLLWPLAAGRPFLDEPCGEPESFVRALALPGGPVLVASPAHLSRLPRLLDLERVPAPAAVFSSGAPLAEPDALAWRARYPAGVVEIYGSTETGGIAWRVQDGGAGAARWRPMDDVALAFREDGLEVTSFRAGRAPVTMADAADPGPDGTFLLRGRLDRTIKLEEQRISLPELEAALAAHPWVERAAVVLLAGPRPVLGAAVVLRAGAPAGRATLVPALRAHLAQRFIGPALPRRWRFPGELPYDERGKLTAQALAGLFRTP